MATDIACSQCVQSMCAVIVWSQCAQSFCAVIVSSQCVQSMCAVNCAVNVCSQCVQSMCAVNVYSQCVQSVCALNFLRTRKDTRRAQLFAKSPNTKGYSNKLKKLTNCFSLHAQWDRICFSGDVLGRLIILRFLKAPL